MWHLIAFVLPWVALAVAFVNVYVGVALLAILFLAYHRIYSSRGSPDKPTPRNSPRRLG
jgi:hypothetical protein